MKIKGGMKAAVTGKDCSAKADPPLQLEKEKADIWDFSNLQAFRWRLQCQTEIPWIRLWRHLPCPAL